MFFLSFVVCNSPFISGQRASWIARKKKYKAFAKKIEVQKKSFYLKQKL